MSKARAKELIDLGDRLFTAKETLDQLNQEIAEQVFPSRADFTTTLELGDEYAAHLDDSFPVLLHRELSDSMSAMLRPKGKQWFRCTTLDDDLDAEVENARYLEHVVKTMWRKLYDARSKFIRATKEGDRDYAAFGMAVISVEEAPKKRDHLYMRSHHLRDCAWLENDIGEIDHLHRKEMFTARRMKLTFGEKHLDDTIKRACEKEPMKEFPVRVIVMPADEYDYAGRDSGGDGGRKGGRAKRLPFTVCYVDVQNTKVLREGGLPDFPYVVPRWQTISGSQYAFSPAAMTALPDARLAQMMAHILLEAGEKAVEPPMIGTEEAVKEVNIQSGAMSWIDYAYDEKLGEALRPLRIEGDFRTGFALRQDLRDLLARAFFIDRLKLPEATGKMTAYEVSQRIEEHVRNLLPLFEPIEVEYNTRLLDKTFSVLRNMGLFPLEEVPEALHHADVTWAFESPLQEAQSRLLVAKGEETLSKVFAAKQSGFIAVDPVYSDRIVKDVVRGINGPATWRKSAEEEQAEVEAMALAKKLEGAAREIATAGEVATRAGQGLQALQGAGVLPMPPPGGPGGAQPGAAPAAGGPATLPAGVPGAPAQGQAGAWPLAA
jgi:hypothetical protein